MLYDIWGPDESSVFATGNNSQALKRNPDGTWKVLYAGGIFYNSSKFSINGSAADDVYFVGGSGEIDHWNGTEYKRLEIESDNSHNIILPDNMEGYYLGMDFGKISKFDGIMRSPLTTHIAADQNWKFAQRAQRIWLAQDVMRSGDTIYAWDGSRLREYDPGIGDLHQIRVTTFKVFDENDIFLAGYQLGGFGYFAKRYNGSQWNDIVKNGQIVEMQDVTRQGSNTFAIAGRNWDNDMDTFLGKPCILDDGCYEDDNFSAITSDSKTIYAVGKNGAIVSYANGTWSLENSSTDKDLTSVAAGGGWVCAAGRDRTIVCKQGNQSWQPVTGLDTREENKFIGIAWSGEESFVAILNTGNDAASNYIGANKGTIYKIDKGQATLLRTGMSSVLGGIGSNSEGKVAIGGSGKVIYGNELPPIEKGAINPGIYMLLLDD